MKSIVALLLLAVAVGCTENSKVEIPVPAPTVTSSPSPSPTVSPSPSPSPTMSPSPSPTVKPSPIPVDVSSLFTSPVGDKAILVPYVRKFVEDAIQDGNDVLPLFKQGAKLYVEIASLDSYGAGVIGLCSMGSGFRELTLDPDFFITQGNIASRLLMHHELGHCILNRRHRNDIGTINDGIGHSHELSIMYPIVFGGLQYTTHEKHYLSELFKDIAVEPIGATVDICNGKDL